MTETAHTSLDFAQNAFKTYVLDNALEYCLTLLFAEAPYLNIPVVRDIIRGLAWKIHNAFWGVMKLFVDLAAIPIINSKLKTVFDERSAEARLILIKYGKDSPEFKAANEGAHDAFADFFRNNSSRPR